MAGKVLAAVRVAPGKTEIREFPMPEIREDSALLKMEVAGICGTDVKLYETPPSNNTPVIMGHGEYWPHRRGRPRVHQAQGIPGRRPRIRGALRHVRPMRVVQSGTVPPL